MPCKKILFINWIRCCLHGKILIYQVCLRYLVKSFLDFSRHMHHPLLHLSSRVSHGRVCSQLRPVLQDPPAFHKPSFCCSECHQQRYNFLPTKASQGVLQLLYIYIQVYTYIMSYLHCISYTHISYNVMCSILSLCIIYASQSAYRLKHFNISSS